MGRLRRIRGCGVVPDGETRDVVHETTEVLPAGVVTRNLRTIFGLIVGDFGPVPAVLVRGLARRLLTSGRPACDPREGPRSVTQSHPGERVAVAGPLPPPTARHRLGHDVSYPQIGLRLRFVAREDGHLGPPRMISISSSFETSPAARAAVSAGEPRRSRQRRGLGVTGAFQPWGGPMARLFVGVRLERRLARLRPRRAATASRSGARRAGQFGARAS